MPSGKKVFSNIKDKRATIYYMTFEQNEWGGSVGVAHSIGPFWAHFRSASGQERITAAAAGFTEEAIITINYRPDIEPGMYVKCMGRPFMITYVDSLEGYKKDLRLHCETKLFPPEFD